LSSLQVMNQISHMNQLNNFSRKSSILAFFCLFYSSLSFSQKGLDITFGFNRSNIIWTNLEEEGWKYKTNIFVGVRTVVVKRKKFDFSTELQYSGKGWSTEDGNGKKQTFNYLDGIHLLNYKPSRKVNFFSGVNTGLLLNEKSVTADKLFDIGLIGGIAVGSDGLMVFCQYNRALTNNELTAGLKELGITVLNSNLQIGVRFSLLKEKLIFDES
jgi:hypothetical protein